MVDVTVLALASSSLVTMDHSTLRGTLDELLQAHTRSNPALNVLLADYTTYHLVLVVTVSVLGAVFLLLAGVFWTRWRRAPPAGRGRWTFERGTFAGFTVLCALVGVALAGLVAIDANTVLHPQNGFSLAVATLGTPAPGTPRAALDQSFAAWIHSDRSAMPALVRARVDARVAFQGTKAAWSAALLVVMVGLSGALWRTLVRRSRHGSAGWARSPWLQGALLLAGAATVACSLLLLVMVVANLQGALAPVAKTLFYG